MIHWQALVISTCGLFLLLVFAVMVATIMDRLHYLVVGHRGPLSSTEVLSDLGPRASTKLRLDFWNLIG